MESVLSLLYLKWINTKKSPFSTFSNDDLWDAVWFMLEKIPRYISNHQRENNIPKNTIAESIPRQLYNLSYTIIIRKLFQIKRNKQHEEKPISDYQQEVMRNTGVHPNISRQSFNQLFEVEPVYVKRSPDYNFQKVFPLENKLSMKKAEQYFINMIKTLPNIYYTTSLEEKIYLFVIDNELNERERTVLDGYLSDDKSEAIAKYGNNYVYTTWRRLELEKKLYKICLNVASDWLETNFYKKFEGVTKAELIGIIDNIKDQLYS
ncbi:hypothetical protein ACFLQG_01320 [Candidatus Zixiibacteriota bacterium]